MPRPEASPTEAHGRLERARAARELDALRRLGDELERTQRTLDAFLARVGGPELEAAPWGQALHTLRDDVARLTASSGRLGRSALDD
jgi:hypothetical protein